MLPIEVDAAPTPFPWHGSKSRHAATIWRALGNVPNYVEPFGGSLAALLARPTPPGIETVNDANCFIPNFWRAIQQDPEAVADACDWPISEADLVARRQWLQGKQHTLRAKVLEDPDYHYFARFFFPFGANCVP